MHPLMAKHLIFRAQEFLLRRPSFAYLAELEQSQWLSRQELEALQQAKLLELLKSAYQHSPWHRARIDAADIDLNHFDLASFQKLPTMDKQDAACNRDSIVWRNVPGGVFLYNTGGSSGKPLVFYYGRARQASDIAARIRARHWWNVDFGEREVLLWGSPIELNIKDKIKQLRDRCLNQLILNAFEMSLINMDAYIEAIQAFNPACIYGYASSIALLAARVQEKAIKLNLPGLKLVSTTGEPLFPHQRRLIAQTFGVPVAGEYGSRDIGLNAYESPAGQTLLTSESVFMEVLDEKGQAVAPGGIGEAVLTGLCSNAQAFIRYRSGDRVRVSGESCRQGRGLQVIDEVMGRHTDFIVKQDGTLMHALALIYVLRAMPGIAEFKCIQHDLKNFEIQIVINPAWQEAMRPKIILGLKKRLGDEVSIEIRIMEHIKAEASGKHRYVVSHVPMPSGLQAYGPPD